MRREPLDVVIAEGSYHSRLCVCGGVLRFISNSIQG